MKIARVRGNWYSLLMGSYFTSFVRSLPGRVGFLALLVMGLTVCSHSDGIESIGGPAKKDPPASGNFAKFLSAELVRFGGRENKLAEQTISAEWVTSRNRFGALIEVTKADYQALTDLLTAEYGDPRLYIKPRENRSATHMYVASEDGLRLFVWQLEKQTVFINIMRPFKLDPKDYAGDDAEAK